MPRKSGHAAHSHLQKALNKAFHFQPSKLEKQCPFFKLTAIFLLRVSKLRELRPGPTNYLKFLKTRRALPNPYAIY